MRCACVLVALWGLLLSACGGAAPRNLILISVDTLRADHLGAYGYPRPTSPAIDALAAAGVLFEDVSSSAPWTLPAHASLLTGRYPSRHGVKNLRQALPAEVATLAEILWAQGFTTAAFVNSRYFHERFGFRRGFRDFDYIEEDVGQALPSAVEAKAVAWLAERGDEPFFLFLHFYDVHSDYASQPEYEARFARSPRSLLGSTEKLVRVRKGLLQLSTEEVQGVVDLYDAGIRQLDDGIGRLVRVLEDQGRLRDTLLILTSDHGEEFLEHGSVLHGSTHFQEQIRVPLLLHGPGLPRGRRVEEMASLVDIMPTALALLGAPAPEGLDGIDLSPAWREGEGLPRRLLFAEADNENSERDMLRVVRDHRYKLHYDRSSGRSALFDLQEDPAETTDVLADQPALAADLRARLDEFMRVETAGTPLPPLGPEEREQLERLGYLP